MKQNKARTFVFIVLALLLLYSFVGRPNWVELCSGLAFFLFGMQCLDDGLHKLAGSKLEEILERSTSTKTKGLFFGVLSIMTLQSTTVVSLLIIAFISTALIPLATGFTIMLGAYLGASTGAWLLAFAGQGVNLDIFAYPLIVLGVLASFNGEKSKAFGRILLGVAFILLAISLMKQGFSSATAEVNFNQYSSQTFTGILLLLGVGFIITTVLQSSHATIMLILTALGVGQINLEAGFILTIGAIWGSSVTTAIVGFLGGSIGGKRLAIAHILFNFVTGTIALLLIKPLTYLVLFIGDYFSFNNMINLALFHTLFNFIGVLLFWGIQDLLITKLQLWLPEKKREDTVILASDLEEINEPPQGKEEHVKPLYLNPALLPSPSPAIRATFQEISHLAQISIEVVCHALNLPIKEMSLEEFRSTLKKNESTHVSTQDSEALYRHYIKGIYGEIISFMSRIQIIESEDNYYGEQLQHYQVILLKLVDSIKNIHQFQYNFEYYLGKPNSDINKLYQALKLYLFENMMDFQYYFSLLGTEESLPSEERERYYQEIQVLIQKSMAFEEDFRHEIFFSIRKYEVNGYKASSLMNDLNYSRRIVKSLYSILSLAFSHETEATPDYSHKITEVVHQNIKILDD